MERIERYGVIALVFLLVTIVAVSLWGEHRQGGGPFSFLRGDRPQDRIEELVAQAEREISSPAPVLPSGPESRMLPLSPEGSSLFAAPPARGAPSLEEAGLEPASPALELYSSLGTASPDADRPILPLADVPALAAPERARAPAGPGYVVQAGDTLGEIAQRKLGSARRWTEIQRLNPGLDPARLRVGARLVLPPRTGSTAPMESSAREAPPAPAAAAVGRRVTIRAGDTLGEIAQRELGSAARWVEIAARNPGLDPLRLIVGRELLLPEGPGPAAAAPVVASASRHAAGERPSRSKVR